jgi:hypothetical protein
MRKRVLRISLLASMLLFGADALAAPSRHVTQSAAVNPITDVPLALPETGNHKSLAILGSNCAPRTEEVAQEAQNNSPPDQAEAVRERHLAELMKIPHVAGVTIRSSAYNVTTFVVEVDKAANVDEVARQVPPKLEGYDVDVEPEPTEVGL